MIYLFFEGEYEMRRPTAVFDAPDGVDVSYAAFLTYLGMPPFPNWEGDVIRWQADLEQWKAAKCAVFAEKGVKDGEAAHRAWLENHPAIRSLPFESWD